MIMFISFYSFSRQGHSHNLLLWTAGVEGDTGGVGVDSVRRLGKALKLDLVDPGQQRELSILLCCKSCFSDFMSLFTITIDP